MQAMYIRVKRNKTTYFIQCDPTETILQIKEKLYNLIDQPANDQRLILMPAGDELEDSKSLADQKVNCPSLSSSFFKISYDLLVQLENIISSIFWVISRFWVYFYRLYPCRYRFYFYCQWPVQLSLLGCPKTGNHIIENEFFSFKLFHTLFNIISTAIHNIRALSRDQPVDRMENDYLQVRNNLSFLVSFWCTHEVLVCV